MLNFRLNPGLYMGVCYCDETWKQYHNLYDNYYHVVYDMVLEKRELSVRKIKTPGSFVIWDHKQRNFGERRKKKLFWPC